MTRSHSRLSPAFVLMLVLAGCTQRLEDRPTPAETASTPLAETTRFEARLLEIARTYQDYHRPDGEARWALADCVAPQVGKEEFSPDWPRLSAAGDPATHGRKLYWLYVRERPPGPAGKGYIQPGKPNPVGQAVVKEAWRPQEVREEAADELPAEGKKLPIPQKGPLVFKGKVSVEVRHGGRRYRPGEKAGLFIMFKLESGTPGTDKGWVYGTVTADGKQVTSAGRVASCMGCHRDAPHDRLFGLGSR